MRRRPVAALVLVGVVLSASCLASAAMSFGPKQFEALQSKRTAPDRLSAAARAALEFSSRARWKLNLRGARRVGSRSHKAWLTPGERGACLTVALGRGSAAGGCSSWSETAKGRLAMLRPNCESDQGLVDAVFVVPTQARDLKVATPAGDLRPTVRRSAFNLRFGTPAKISFRFAGEIRNSRVPDFSDVDFCS